MKDKRGKIDEGKSKKTEGKATPSSDPKEIFGEFARTTSRVVQEAASILEEEIAAGAIAAKKMEQYFLNVDEIRSEDPGNLMQRFRKDTHEVVDIVIYLLSAATKYAKRITDRAVTINVGDEKDKTRGRFKAQPPTLMVQEPIKAGESAVVTMALRNESNEPFAKLGFYCTDLVSLTNMRIPAKQVEFVPQSITIAPGKSETVAIRVNVPKKTSTGTYSGLIQASKIDQLRAVLVAHVK